VLQGTGGSAIPWYTLITPYLGDSTKRKEMTTDPNRGAGQTTTASAVFTCPSDNNQYWGTSYGMSCYFDPNRSWTEAPVMMSKIQLPDQKVVVADAVNLQIVDGLSTWPIARPINRHNGFASCLFCDGHVSIMFWPSDYNDIHHGPHVRGKEGMYCILDPRTDEDTIASCYK